MSATNAQLRPKFCTSFGDVVHSEGSQEVQTSRFSQYSQGSNSSQSPQLELASPLDDPMFYHMPEDHLQPMYVSPEVVARYYPDHEPAYFVPGMGSSNEYPADPLVALPNATSSHISPLSALQHSPTWDMQSQRSIAIPSGGLADHQQSPTFQFLPTQDSFDMYPIPNYNMHTYDSFEFQTLREHRMNAAQLASQVA